MHMYFLNFMVLFFGQILLYDLRSSRPLLVKDHNFCLPIKDIEFHQSQNLVLSCDSRILKIWDEHTVWINSHFICFVSLLTFILIYIITLNGKETPNHIWTKFCTGVDDCALGTVLQMERILQVENCCNNSLFPVKSSISSTKCAIYM